MSLCLRAIHGAELPDCFICPENIPGVERYVRAPSTKDIASLRRGVRQEAVPPVLRGFGPHLGAVSAGRLPLGSPLNASIEVARSFTRS